MSMPIYAYRCSSCGCEKDILCKISDEPLTTCPDCHDETFTKQLTAPGFQLKGSGWYATDFKSSGSKPKEEAKPESAAQSKTDSQSKAEAPPCQGGAGACACG
jgi:putative FmdB family regulatory protein